MCVNAGSRVGHIRTAWWLHELAREAPHYAWWYVTQLHVLHNAQTTSAEQRFIDALILQAEGAQEDEVGASSARLM